MPAAIDDTRTLNNAFADMVQSGDAVEMKKATDSLTNFTRMKVRESMVLGEILPLEERDSFDIRVSDAREGLICNKEPDTGPAHIVPLGVPGDGEQITGDRYFVPLYRSTTPIFTQDIDELRSYDYDIRQVISDNAVKDLDGSYDKAWFKVVDNVVGAPGSTDVPGNPFTQHLSIGSITRASLLAALAPLRRTPTRAAASCVVVNQLTVLDIMALVPDEVGETASHDLWMNGEAALKFLDVRWIVTIKNDVVADGVLYLFVAPSYLGRHIAPVGRDVVLHTKVEGPNLEFYAFGRRGAAIGNVYGVAKATVA